LRMAFLSIHSSPLGAAGTKDTGGMSTYLRGFAAALGEKGHRVDIFTRAGEAGRNRVIQLAPRVRLIETGDGKGPLEKLQIYPHRAAVADAIEGFRRKEDISYDLILSHYWISGTVGQLLQKVWKCPHLIMFHTLGRIKNETCSGEKEPSLRLEREEELARSCDRVVVASNLERENVVACFDLPATRLMLIPAGVDRNLFRPLDKIMAKEEVGLAGRKVILAVGRIEPVKGLDLLVEAAGQLADQEKPAVLLIGGDEQSAVLSECLQERAAKIGLSGQVFFKGTIAHESLPLYYNAADLTVIPSFYESFGLVALESLACGTPLVSGPVGVVPELISPGGHNSLGFCLIDRDPISWAAAMEQLLPNPAPLCEQDIDRALMSYNWHSIADQFATACELLHKKRT
jgi:D-inositol-3-phosphate glycosyltransferase